MNNKSISVDKFYMFHTTNKYQIISDTAKSQHRKKQTLGFLKLHGLKSAPRAINEMNRKKNKLDVRFCAGQQIWVSKHSLQTWFNMKSMLMNNFFVIFDCRIQ